MKLIAALLLSVACVGQIVVPKSELNYQDFFKPKGETRTCIVSNQTHEVVYSDLAGSMVPAVMGPTSIHYDCVVTVYRQINRTNLPPNNRVMIGKPFKGTYVPGGCFEDVPENMVAYAYQKAALDVAATNALNSPFDPAKTAPLYSFATNQFTNPWKWTTNNLVVRFTDKPVGFSLHESNRMSVMWCGTNVLSMVTKDFPTNIGHWIKSDYLQFRGTMSDDGKSTYGFHQLETNQVRVIFNNVPIYTINGANMGDLK